MTVGPIRAVGVVVPARDEEHHIGRCLRSLRRALGELPGQVTTAVTVVLDRCRDRTPEEVATVLRGWPEASALRVGAVGGHRARASPGGSGPVHIVAGSGVGALRHLGLGHCLERLGSHPPAGTWLLSTDADTTVPPDWVLAHLRLAAAGAVAVAGLADLDGTADLSAVARRRYRRLVREGIDGTDHRHVYAANLGVRADAYLAVDGFPVDGSGEDHGLWWRLAEAGHRLARPTSVRVRTSARVRGRAAGGLADLLHALHGPAVEDPCDAPPAG